MCRWLPAWSLLALSTITGCGAPAEPAAPWEPSAAEPRNQLPPRAAGAISAIERINQPSLPNALRIHQRVISGGLPEGDEAFAALRDLGVQTVISVDGARPDVETARRYGLRYVHLPHGYDGISQSHAQRLAKAVRDLPGVIYIHCHHGKHRSPAAAAVACVSIGWLDAARASNVLQIAGTSPQYRGLFDAVDRSRRIDDSLLDGLPADFPEVAAVPPLADAMVQIQHVYDELQRLRDSGWKPPPDHPELVPTEEALLLKEQFRELLRTDAVHRRGDAFVESIRQAEASAGQLEAELQTWQDSGRLLRVPPAVERAMQAINANCAACHAKFRDSPQANGEQPSRPGAQSPAEGPGPASQSGRAPR
jgi:protein tyrosine phosphatase (PTP) superfamily phosphohydrolase (DUF442 family)